MSHPINLTEQNVAIHGYDPVSYFTADPVPGSSDITATHGEAIYYFTTPENKAKFEANPETYVPQYGGAVRLRCLKVNLSSSIPKPI